MWVWPRREVAAGAGGDPAAERRELERLREVAQRQPVLAELVLELRARRAGLDRAARETRSTSSTRSSAPQVDRHRGRVALDRGSTPPTTLVPPPNGIAAAPADGAPVEQPRHVGLVARARDHVGRVVDLAAEGAHHVAVGPAVGVGGALVGVGRADLGQRRGRLEPRGAGARGPSSRHRALDLRGPEAEVLAGRRGGGGYLGGGRLLVLVAPAPELQLTERRTALASNRAASQHGMG